MTPAEKQVEREIWFALERLVTRMENFFAWRQAAQKYRDDQARWQAGSPGGIGGQFAPEHVGTAYDSYLRGGRRPVQLAFAGDDTLRWAMPDRKGGHEALSQIASPYTAAAVADPLFRYPGPDGTRLVQTAVDQAISGLPDDVRQRHRDLFANHRVDGKFGQETMNAIVALEQEGFGPHLREAMANLRYHKPEEEAWRYEHFRFRGKP